MDPLSPLDALFLHTEDGITHMHIGSCAIFAGPSPSITEITALIESKLPVLARYRQKVRFVPGHLGHPVWVDDPTFDLAYHVRHTALPPPGDVDELEHLMGRLMSHELDRGRPLWEAWIVEGLSGGRWALISKVHHCMVDGVSGTDMMAALLDADPAARTQPALPWRPRRTPSDMELAADAVVRMVATPARRVLAMSKGGVHLGRVQRDVSELAAGMRSLGAGLARPAAHLSVEGLIGPHRRWSAGRCRLGDIKAIRAAFGGSVNDVVMAAVTGAFRDIVIRRGESVDGVVMRSLVPVSVRRPDDHTANNQVALMVAELPLGIADPVERLHAIRAEMRALKGSHQPTAAGAIVAAAELVPPALLALGARTLMTMLRRLPQGAVHTVTTNVPGPQQPLFALGREMLEYLPFVPVSEGVRIGVAIMSYNGAVSFGVTGDYDTAPDVHLMSARIERHIELLLDAAQRVSAAS